MAIVIRDIHLIPFEIDIDSNNHTLVECKTQQSGKNAGEEIREVVGHYTSVAGALDRVIREKLVAKNKIISLSEYYAEYRKLMDNFTSVIKKATAIPEVKK